MKKKFFSAKAVIFDMDGVITNTMPDHFKAWKLVLADYGIHVTHLDIYSREGQRGIHSVREIGAKYGKTFTEDEKHKILAEKEELFKKITKQRFIPGARNFLKNLKKRDFHLALVTGTSRHELHRILPDELYKLFDVAVSGSDVKHGKPHPEPFLKSIKDLNIKATEGIVLENAPFGIRSAREAGLRCLALQTSLPAKYLKEATMILKSYNDLNTKIELINEKYS